MGSSLTNNNTENTQCSIVGLRGILIQVSLGVLSFSVLIIKRFFERPRRPWKIWGFDTVKQVISQLLAHFINLLISLLLTSNDPDSDTCLWYFITNVFDNTVGVFFCVFSLRLIQKFLYKYQKYEIISGNYYETAENQRRDILQGLNNQQQQRQRLATTVTKISYKAWLLQLLIWNGIVIVAKLSLFTLEFFLSNQLDFVSKLVLGWIQAYPNLQLVVVIVIVPLIMNGFAFWIQDNFLKKRPIPKPIERQILIQLQSTPIKENNQNDIPNNQQKNKINKSTDKQEFIQMNEQIDVPNETQPI